MSVQGWGTFTHIIPFFHYELIFLVLMIFWNYLIHEQTRFYFIFFFQNGCGYVGEVGQFENINLLRSLVKYLVWGNCFLHSALTVKLWCGLAIRQTKRLDIIRCVVLKMMTVHGSHKSARTPDRSPSSSVCPRGTIDQLYAASDKPLRDTIFGAE